MLASAEEADVQACYTVCGDIGAELVFQLKTFLGRNGTWNPPQHTGNGEGSATPDRQGTCQGVSNFVSKTSSFVATDLAISRLMTLLILTLTRIKACSPNVTVIKSNSF